MADPLVMPMMEELLACLDLEISKVDNPPLYVQMRAGSVVDHLISTTEDECCSGLAWVRPAGFYPSSEYPAQDEAGFPKGTLGWAVTLELGAIRCAPTPDHNRIPTGEEWESVTRAVMDDAAAMRRAICCYIDANPGARNRTVIPGLWQPLSVQGGCVGGVMTVTLRGPACDCAEAGVAS